jgi:aldehyde:ferredoxin oxidoreductase
MFLNYNVDQMVEMANAATGWSTSAWELMKIAERAVTMARVFNLREGFTSHDDTLPKRFYEQLPNAHERNNLNEESLERAKRLYYNMMGWSETGIPTPAKLHELDIGWIEA